MSKAKTPLLALSLLAAVTAGGCTKEKTIVEDEQVPIACQLNALTAAERVREGELLEEHLASVLETRERDEGYSFRYGSDPGLFARVAELVSLEHRCCPFLDFRLEWMSKQDGPWLHITGGARVKPFVEATFR